MITGVIRSILWLIEERRRQQRCSAVVYLSTGLQVTARCAYICTWSNLPFLFSKAGPAAVLQVTVRCKVQPLLRSTYIAVLFLKAGHRGCNMLWRMSMFNEELVGLHTRRKAFVHLYASSLDVDFAAKKKGPTNTAPEGRTTLYKLGRPLLQRINLNCSWWVNE